MNSLRDVQYDNMWKMVNSFLYEYRCDIEMRSVKYEKEVYEIQKENKRKRKRILHEFNEERYLIVHGNGSETICTIFKNKNGFDIYIKDNLPWRGDEIFKSCETNKEASEIIEEICRNHYFEKYGIIQEPYSCIRKSRKRLSVGEICDWYNQFRKLDVSINDIKDILQENKKLKSEISSYERMLLGVARKQKLI